MPARNPSRLFDCHMGDRLAARSAAASPWHDKLLSIAASQSALAGRLADLAGRYAELGAETLAEMGLRHEAGGKSHVTGPFPCAQPLHGLLKPIFAQVICGRHPEQRLEFSLQASLAYGHAGSHAGDVEFGVSVVLVRNTAELLQKHLVAPAEVGQRSL